MGESMKNKTAIHLLIIYTGLLISSCAYFTAHGRSFKQAESAFKAKIFDQAVRSCVKSLSIKPNYEDALLLMDTAFPKAIKKHHRKIERMKDNREGYYWDRVLGELKVLNELKELVEDLEHPKSEIWLTSADVRVYSLEINQARENAAEDHYQSGLKLKNITSDRTSQKLAAEQFQITQSFIADFKDSQALYLECKKAGTTRVAIIPFANKSGKSYYGSVGENISTSIRSNMMNDPLIMEYVKIIDRQQIDNIINEQKLSQSGLVNTETSIEIGKLLGVHQIISGEVTRLIAGEPSHITSNTAHNKDVVIDKKKYIGDDGKSHTRNIYANVKAKLTTHTLSASASAKASFQVVDTQTAEVLHSEIISGDAKFEHKWASVSGDVRALDNTRKKLTKKTQKSAPSREQMIMNAVDNLTLKMTRKIKKVYK